MNRQESQFEFDYYYGQESEQFSFFRIPKMLVTEERFSKISSDTFTLLFYGKLLDRISLSRKNGWIDQNNRVYVIYTLDEAMEDFRKSHPTITRALKTLESIGLIERKKQGQGKPTLIYVKNFAKCIDTSGITTENNTQNHCNDADCKKVSVKSENNLQSRVKDSFIADRKNISSSNTDISDTNISDTKDLLSCLLRARGKKEKKNALVSYIEPRIDKELDYEDLLICNQLIEDADTDLQLEMLTISVDDQKFRKLNFKMVYVKKQLERWRIRHIVEPYAARLDILEAKWQNHHANTIAVVRNNHPKWDNYQVADEVERIEAQDDELGYLYRMVTSIREAYLAGDDEKCIRLSKSALSQGVSILEYIPLEYHKAIIE